MHVVKHIFVSVLIPLLLLSGCGAVADAVTGLPQIEFTDTVTNFMGDEPITATGLMLAAAARAEAAAGPTLNVGSGGYFVSEYQCLSLDCELLSVVVDYGFEPRMRPNGSRTPVAVVEFGFDVAENEATAMTYVIGGGSTIVDDLYLTTVTPTVEEALRLAQTQYAFRVIDASYRARVSAMPYGEGWQVNLSGFEDGIAHRIIIPFTN